MGRVFVFLLGVVLAGVGLAISDNDLFAKVGPLAPYVANPVPLGSAELYRPVIAIVVGGLGGLVALGALFGHRSKTRKAAAPPPPQALVVSSDSFTTEPPPEPAPFPAEAIAALTVDDVAVAALSEPAPFPITKHVAEPEPDAVAAAVAVAVEPEPTEPAAGIEAAQPEGEPDSVVEHAIGARSEAVADETDIWVWMTPDHPSKPARAEAAPEREEVAILVSPPALATLVDAPEPPPPPASEMEIESFDSARQKLRELARDENWPAAAGVLGRLHRLAANPAEHALAAQDLGTFHRAQGKTEDAAEAYEQALYYAREVSPPDPVLLGGALTDVGDVAMDESRLELAVAAYGELVDLRRAQVAADASPENRRLLSLALERMGDAREDRGHRSRALELYRESMVIADDLAAADPARYGPELEVTRGRVAELEALLA